MDVRDVGVQVAAGRLRVARLRPGPGVPDQLLRTGLNQSGEREYDVLIDTNGDGQADFVVDLGTVLTGVADGRFGSFTIDASSGDIIDAFFADAPMNGSTIELPAVAARSAWLQKAAKPTAFRYAVNAFSLVPESSTRQLGVVRPVGRPGGDFQSGRAGGGAASLPLSIGGEKTPTLGWLVACLPSTTPTVRRRRTRSQLRLWK